MVYSVHPPLRAFWPLKRRHGQEELAGSVIHHLGTFTRTAPDRATPRQPRPPFTDANKKSSGPIGGPGELGEAVHTLRMVTFSIRAHIQVAFRRSSGAAHRVAIDVAGLEFL
jgi:hypothetical protein